MLQFSILSVVITIFIVHTILSHLLNWAIREFFELNYETLAAVSVVSIVFEFIICIVLLRSILI